MCGRGVAPVGAGGCGLFEGCKCLRCGYTSDGPVGCGDTARLGSRRNCLLICRGVKNCRRPSAEPLDSPDAGFWRDIAGFTAGLPPNGPAGAPLAPFVEPKELWLGPGGTRRESMGLYPGSSRTSPLPRWGACGMGAAWKSNGTQLKTAGALGRLELACGPLVVVELPW